MRWYQCSTKKGKIIAMHTECVRQEKYLTWYDFSGRQTCDFQTLNQKSHQTSDSSHLMDVIIQSWIKI